jgi:hypothetical protein
MHRKTPWDHLKRVGESPGRGLPIQSETGITGPKWCPTTAKAEEEVIS